MHTERKKKFMVTISKSDREVMRVRCPRATLAELDKRAVARAAAREVFLSSKSVADALDTLVSEIPRDALEGWMKSRLKNAA